ncbi:LPS export ABC transporter periplasmic protein LptC [Salinispira pacifica]|uniref:LPS export ABC transporter periplasmic protein LptC n=1 Tax=Salinispira pacifica TaxID=1307761 RepID=V5WM03_9SPIO|nr:LPS export ABC transporter periplasmic protein LptC [Salinispira pacifica]AHC16640.1 hypothetical protein L21SP2_3300 [Salinispira pacifica]
MRSFFPPALPIYVVLSAAMVALLGSCSFDYDQMAMSEEEKQQIPDVSLSNIVERVYEDGNLLLELQSDILRTFEERELQEIEGLSFTQYNEDASVSLQGRAGFASRDLDSEDILLRDGVEIYITDSESRVLGDQFLYSPEQDLIWSPDDEWVELIRDDGSQFRGRGFVVDLLLQELRFDGGGTGRIITGSGDENNRNETSDDEPVGEEERQ